MGKGIPIRGTQATIYEPVGRFKYWRIVYVDRVTGKRRTTSGGSSRELAESKARELSGEFVAGWRAGDYVPTVSEAVESWLASNQSRWSSRTYDQYYYFGKKLIDRFGGRPVTHVGPADIATVDVASQSRGQQEKARSLVRGIFNHAGPITKEQADRLAQGIRISGTAAGKRNPLVPTNDIPSSKLIAAFIITASHTLQRGPLKEWDELRRNLDRPDQRYGSMRVHPGLGLTGPAMVSFLDGLPVEVTDKHRRGIPQHYSDPEARRRTETKELASRYRQIALATALGAGGGLRIGEVLALRVRHVVTAEQWSFAGRHDWRLGALMEQAQTDPRLLPFTFNGTIDVSEQASQASKGKIWVTGTKGRRKSRTVHLPAFLPNWNGFGRETHRAQVAEVIERFNDPQHKMWSATEEESFTLWSHGFTPLNWLLWERLRELWQHPAIAHLDAGPRTTEFRDLLLFPTRNQARKSRGGLPSVLTDPGWRKPTRIVPGTGTYQSQSNYAKLVNPLYDWVADQFLEYPEHRTNSTQRQGWTHHGLRHYAVSSRIKAGVPLPLTADEMGHHDSSFTLERYGHLVDDGVGAGGFEF